MKKYQIQKTRGARGRAGRSAASVLAVLVALAFFADEAGASKPWWQEAVAAPVIDGAPYSAGERLRYTVRVLGKDAGNAELRVGRESTREGRLVRAVKATVRSLGFFDSVFPVRDEASAHIDLATATPVRATLTVDENRKPVREIDLSFGGTGNGHISGTRTIGDKTDQIDVHTPVRALDPLSALYHLRARTLVKDTAFPLFIHNGKRVYRVDVRVMDKNDVWTDLGMKKGWELRMRIRRADGSRPEWRQNMTLWISADAARVPLKLTFPMPVGKVEATLSAVKGVAVAPSPTDVRRAAARAPVPLAAPAPMPPPAPAAP